VFLIVFKEGKPSLHPTYIDDATDLVRIIKIIKNC